MLDPAPEQAPERLDVVEHVERSVAEERVEIDERGVVGQFEPLVGKPRLERRNPLASPVGVLQVDRADPVKREHSHRLRHDALRGGR